MSRILFALLFLVGCSTKKDEDTLSKKYAVITASNGATYHTGLLQTPEALKHFGASHITFNDCGDLPDSFDLRPLGVIPDIKDQGQCGSCWSFSKTGSLESALLGQGIKLNLSEQELVSNDKTQWGCQGGLLSDFSYQIKHGQGLEKDFPYTARDSAAKNIPVAAKGVSFQYVGTASRGPTASELKCALYKYHTMPWITVSASNAWGSPPASEKVAYTRCANGQTNHAVGVVGWWKDSRGKDQFIMKNSWGKNWGDQGYMSLPLGCDAFGEEVAFIEVEKTPTPPPGPTPPPPGPTPPPGPCGVPHVDLPAEVQVFTGKEVMLGVKAETGVAYTWTVDGKIVGSDSMLYTVPPKDAVYKLLAKNTCATAESQVRVRIVQSLKGAL